MYELIIKSLITGKEWKEKYNSLKAARRRYYRIEHSKVLFVVAFDTAILY